MSEENVVEFPDSLEEWPLLPKMYLRIAMGDQSAADLLETVAVIAKGFCISNSTRKNIMSPNCVIF